MELLQLEYFHKIAHSSTLTQAAEELYVSQPALSKMVRSLEKEFQVKLFDKEGRSLKLNEKGEILLRHATEVLDSLEALRSEMKECREREDMTLRLGVYAASRHLPDIVMGFREEHPNVKLKLVQHKFEDSQKANTLDLLITSSDELMPEASHKLLLKEEMVLAVPEHHPAAEKGTVTLDQLKDEDFIGLSQGKVLRTVTDNYCRRIGFEPRVVLESDDPATVRSLVAAGIGVAFIPEKTWKAEEEFDRVVRIEEPKCERYLYLTSPKGARSTTAARLFENYIVKYFAEQIK